MGVFTVCALVGQRDLIPTPKNLGKHGLKGLVLSVPGRAGQGMVTINSEQRFSLLRVGLEQSLVQTPGGVSGQQQPGL